MDDLIISKLNEYKQDHVLKNLSQLNSSQKEILFKQLERLDFDNVSNMFKNGQIQNEATELLIKNLRPLTLDQIDFSVFRMQEDTLKEYELLGLEAISRGEVAVLCLAGGMSTRLSISYPKGIYSVDLLSCKSLFQLQAEKLRRITHLSNEACHNSNDTSVASIIPWYIMTSEHTHEETCDFFEKNDYFGVNKVNVVFFQQQMLPCLSKEGNLILNEDLKLCQAPNGSNGLYDALVDNHILEDMGKRGVKYVHIYSVENLLVKMADPMFTGICIKNDIESAMKVFITLVN